MDENANIIKEKLNKFIGKATVINQEGFLESKYFIQCFIYSIEHEILNIIDEKSEVYLKINLNQIYKIENKEKQIKLFLDNDTIILLIK